MTPSRPGPLLGATLVVALLALPACSQGGGSESAGSPAEAPSPPPSEVATLDELTCAEVNDTFGSEEQEEEASYLAVWAYGVRTGVEGLDFEKRPVTQAGLEDFVTGVILACGADPEKLFVDAILE